MITPEELLDHARQLERRTGEKMIYMRIERPEQGRLSYEPTSPAHPPPVQFPLVGGIGGRLHGAQHVTTISTSAPRVERAKLRPARSLIVVGGIRHHCMVRSTNVGDA